jgi:hypothetical protein
MFNEFNNDDLSTLWDETEPAERKSFSDIPDGKYEAKVNTVRLDKSKSGKPMISWDLIISKGDQEGRHVFNNQLIETPQQISFVKAQLRDLGLDVSSLQTLQTGLASLLDAILAIQAKTRPATADYEARQNIYLNKVIAYGNSIAAEDLPF